MKKTLVIAIPIAIALAISLGHMPARAPEIADTATSSLGSNAPQGEPGLSITPASIEQGDPARIIINGASLGDIKSLTWSGKPVGILLYDGKPTAFIGVDLKAAPGSYPLTLTLNNGKVIKKDIQVGKRLIAEAPLGIPESLGGNTTTSEESLVAELAKENAIISKVPTSRSALWSEKFRFPLDGSIVITDPYGYTRLTGASTISHKGTDFRASVGTPVYAMNSGTVRIATNFIDYGGTAIIDHGLGLQTLYMHLSELYVKPGDAVAKGQIIGKSGQTGYAEAPHLHISVKIGGISIDPMKFMRLFD